MLLQLTHDRIAQDSAGGPASVRPLHDDEHEVFAEVLGAAFGPPAVIIRLYTPLARGQPLVRAYVAEVEGPPAAVGLGSLTGEHTVARSARSGPGPADAVTGRVRRTDPARR
ncbi:hypothetical protein [Streptomyces sp. NPDC052107]|uniref:hypothetical protein n=1 Tax=Streptomyces sp. NPDC052107 TaxID=3155632 RepID=UPI003439C411